MTSASRMPRGRMGRLRLRHSLEVADRGAELLDRKLRILREEHTRLLRAADAGARSWAEALRRAELWLTRAVLLGGERPLDAAAADVGRAEVTVAQATTMGVRHPSAVGCVVPDRPATAAAPGNTALVHAETAYRQALRAAAEYTALRAAADLIGAEAQRTRRRVRALRHHWIPRLEAALTQVGQALEQDEHEDAVRRRWAARTRSEQE
ncbi:V-type ATP synthase subunit D [Streptomyces sp. XD-27]|uniref:V-type ATP synthase subunit D n=1 Tax=Streptomyces sp. XD-27 TaxID=3062779 RepID=UPI0026F47AA7|nr:V-type ATP synthase subunit D [Streptomyces sp. XD-27]WKX69011.1 V-type ATP synthase subunit D [Streptomyces sp. XD-27]